jgi:hypothetical protein
MDGGTAGVRIRKGDLIMVDDIEDRRRREPTGVGSEREMLQEWLEVHRITLLLKCEALDEVDLKRRPVVTSNLSLQGLVRHMPEVERNWFQRVLQGKKEPFTASEQRGSRATLRPFRVPDPVWNQKLPSNQSAPTAVMWGLPSSFTVVSHVVRALWTSGAGDEPASSFSRMSAQFTGGSPSAAPKLMMSTTSPFS